MFTVTVIQRYLPRPLHLRGESQAGVYVTFLLCQHQYLSAHKSPSLRLEDLRQRHRVHLLLIIFSFAQSNQSLQGLGASYIYCVRSNASRLCRQRYCSKLSAMRITHWLSCHVGLDQTIETGCARALPTHRYLIMRQPFWGQSPSWPYHGFGETPA